MCTDKLTPFYAEPKFAVSVPNTFCGTLPKHTISADWGLQVALYLASEGLFQGNPENVFKCRAGLVIDTYNYIQFKKDFKYAINYMAEQERS